MSIYLYCIHHHVCPVYTQLQSSKRKEHVHVRHSTATRQGCQRNLYRTVHDEVDRTCQMWRLHMSRLPLSVEMCQVKCLEQSST
jgi:hypothetical protein